MAEVLEQWMVKIMGYMMKLSAPEVGESLYDGTVFHDILCKYNIINFAKCSAPPRNPSTEVAVQSLVDLGLWFKLLGITHSKELLESAAQKDPRACLRILFELFAKLQTQDNTHFLMKQKAAETQQSTSGRFAVTKAIEPAKPLDHPPAYFHTEDPLRERIGIVENYKTMKERMAKWSKAEMQRRRDVVKQWSERQTYLDSEFEQASQQSTPPEDPIQVFNKYLEASKPREESLVITNREYVAYLRQKRRKTLTSYVLKVKMQETLLHDLWADILEERDIELTEVFQEILLQQCEYEKKLTVTLQKLHDNYKNFSEFSNYINDLAEDEYSLAETIYQSNKRRQKENDREKEMERVLELHKRLWDEKLRVKREQHIQYCGKIVRDLVNHAIKLCEFRNEFHDDPPQKTLDEWKELFFKELPVLRDPNSFVNQLLEDDTIERPEILKATIEEITGQTVGMTNEGEVPATKDIQQDLPFNAEPQVQSFLQPFQPETQNYPLNQVTEPDRPENVEWKVLMDFERYELPSSARLPYMVELQTPHQSKDTIKALEDKKKCEDDIECLLDRDVVDCVNSYNLRTYLNTAGPWDLKQWPQIWETVPFDEKLNVLGYVVHRLLDLKYPLPKGPKKPRLPNFQIKAILGKFSDPQVAYILECLRDLLAKEKVEVIDVSMPVNYCLNVYKEEMEITEVGSVLKTSKSLKESGIKHEDEDRLMPYKRWDKRPPRYPEKPPRRPKDLLPLPSPPESVEGRHSRKSKAGAGGRKSMARKSVARKSKAGGSRKSVARKSKAGGSRKSVARKSKAGGSRKSVARKSVARKSKVGGRKSMGGQRKSRAGSRRGSKSSKQAAKKSVVGYLGMNKATQIPSLPDLRKRYKHSPAGKLGKVAFETLAEGKKINDALLGNMLIEYLKTLDDKKGFVLVNFPTSALQANIFEHQLGGLPLQYLTKIESEVDLFHTNEENDIYGHLRCFLDFEKLLFDYVKEPEPPPDPIEAILAQEEEAQKIKKLEKKEHGGKKVSRKSMSQKSMSRKSVARKSAAPRKSKTARKSVARKSVARKSVARKSVAGKRKSTAGGSKGKSPDKDKKKSDEKKVEEVEDEPASPPPPPPPPEEPPKPPLTLEQLNRFRISEILPRPNKDLDDLLYGAESYFTKYVHPLQMQAMKKDQLELVRVKTGPFDHDPAVMLVKEENKTRSFYKGLGLITDFDYMRFDQETIKRLARVILGVVWDEDDMTRKPSIELFGVGNLEKVGRGPPGSESSGSSKGSRASFYETKKAPKFLYLEANREKAYKKYMPIKPPPPPPPPPEPTPVEEPDTAEDDKKVKGKKSKTSGGSRKSIKSKSSRKSMSRKSVARKSVARKSMKRKSTARKSKISQKRQSTAKRQSKAGSVKKKSAAEGGGKKSREKPESEKEPSIILPPKPMPGEPDWTYVNEPIPYETGFTAATVWECAEYAYLENMEKIFYLLRIHDMKVLPYKEYVKESLRKAMVEDSEKRHLVTNFQLMLNKVDDDYRHDDDMKYELYVRAKELYDLMTVVAMERRERSLIKKAELIGQGWAANQVYTLANLYLSMMQVELNMYVDSLQVLNDYYMGILGAIPKPEIQSKVTVAKNRMAMEEEIVISRMSSTGGRKRRKTASRSSLPPITIRHSLVIPMKIQHLLLKTDAAPSSSASPTPPEPNPTYPLVSHADSLKGKIKDLNSTYQGIINDPELGKELRGRKMGEWLKGGPGGQLALPGPAAKESKRRKSQRKSTGGQRKSTSSKRKSTGGKRKSQGGQRKSQAGKRKSQGGKRKSQGGQRKSSVKRQSKVGGKNSGKGGRSSKKAEAVDELPDMVDVAKEEWTAAVDYASRRTEFRLQLIEARAKKDLDRVLDIIKELFFEYQTHVDEQLIKELAAIDECMYVFKRAIEDGSPIQPLMVLDDNKFYVDRTILLFPDPPPPPPLPLVEARDPYSFTVEQLTTLVNKFSQMAPMGVIETPMIQVLREMAIAGFESGKPTLPSAWAKLDSFDYKEIFNEAFGDQTCLDWRNFLINIADLPYPTIEQLQSLKNEYSIRDLRREVIVTRKDFDDIRLWFENEFGDTIETDLKLSLAKPLIFNMFKINNDEMNYYDMLMGYCRAEDPEDGLGMALDLLLDSGFLLQPEKCLREDEFDKIHPRKIVDFILVNFFTDLLNLTETVELKYLPRLTNREVFASEENEFEISEDILRQNKGTRKDYGDLSSTDSETNRPKPERILYLDDDDEMPAKYCCEKWQMCVPYEIALALILNALNYYALSPIHQHRILNIEQRLKDLYVERGTGTHIRAYRLTTSDLFKELYAKTNIFKKTNIIGMVEKIIERKRDNSGGKPASELAKD